MQTTVLRLEVPTRRPNAKSYTFFVVYQRFVIKS